MGNLYLTELDLFIKHNLKCANYLRYSDDFCVFHNDKDFLNNVRDGIDEFVQQNLNLKLSKAIIKPVEGMMFVGFRLFKKFILLRQRTVKKIKHRMHILFRKNAWSDSDVASVASVASMCGVMGWAKTYNLRKIIKNTPFGVFLSVG